MSEKFDPSGRRGPRAKQEAPQCNRNRALFDCCSALVDYVTGAATIHEDALLLEALLGRGATPAGICHGTCGTREGAPLRGRMNDTCFTRDAGLQPDTGVLGIHPHRPSRTCRLHREKQQVQRVPPPQHFPANGRQSALLALIFPQRTHSIQRLQPRQALPPTARTFSGCSGGR